MITANNYFEEVKRIGVDNLPETLRKGHDYVIKSTGNGSTWNNYHNSETIRKVIDLYFQKLQEFAAASKGIQKEEGKPRAPKPYPVRAEPKNEGKKAPLSKAKPALKSASVKRKAPAKKVEHIREEVKYIKRYVGLHNKIKSPNAILAFIKALQRSIVQKLIRKTSPLAKEISMIQDKLINVYNRMKGEEKFAINGNDLQRLAAIAGGEEVYPSVRFIKRFISMQGKNLEPKRIEDFIKQLDNAIKRQSISSNDPFGDKLNQIYKKLKTRKSNTINLTEAELSGLEGIVKACSCNKHLVKIYRTDGKKLRQCKKRTYSDARKGACSHNQGLSGVLTAEQMANRKLDLLNFFSFWFTLFGKPARNFTMMFHGGPHNGKTILLLKFAQFLAENFGKVLYISSEEFASPTMTKKVNEFLNPLPHRLHFAENLKEPTLSEYDFIILDSVNDLGLKVSSYKELRARYPDKAFIFILQHTKAGDFKGGKDWEHIAEIVGEVEKGVITITKNRYAPKTIIDFFRQFDIEWHEPEISSLGSPNLIREDMVAGDSSHI
jgi:hypothetical protein